MEQFSLKAFHCRDCVRAYNVEWRKNNPEKERERSAKWCKNHPEKVRAKYTRWRHNHPGYDAEWRKNNSRKDRITRNKYQKERRANDLNFKMIKDIRSAMGNALRNTIKSGHTIELLGCSIKELREHIERQFQPGMTWDNWGRYGWHIDHIIPLSYFDFTDYEQQKRAFHYTNLQPLWAEDNLRKGTRYWRDS